MLNVGLTGGIGSGKSTVAELLAGHGAVIVDSGRIAREVVEPGTPGLAAVTAEFGTDVLTPDGALDRPRLGAIVFADEERRRALNAIVHPLVRARSAELEEAAPPDAIVVHDVPLLAENGLGPLFDLVLVVDATEQTRPPARNASPSPTWSSPTTATARSWRPGSRTCGPTCAAAATPVRTPTSACLSVATTASDCP
jgi:dephospho-CoA kinase